MGVPPTGTCIAGPEGVFVGYHWRKVCSRSYAQKYDEHYQSDERKPAND
jgi:hypothetical protein